MADSEETDSEAESNSLQKGFLEEEESAEEKY
jgi:hypothetical protein